MECHGCADVGKDTGEDDAVFEIGGFFGVLEGFGIEFKNARECGSLYLSGGGGLRC